MSKRSATAKTSTATSRQRPNILFTGTPGTGKTALARRVAESLNFNYIDIAGEVKKQGFHLADEFDSRRNCHVLDEEKLLDYLEGFFGAEEGGFVCDYHASELFPQRWFDFVLVLRCPDTSVLYDRLAQRDGYTAEKVRENVECEIFGTVAEEAHDSYDESAVHELNNETWEQAADNVTRITQLVGEWEPTGSNKREKK